MPQETLIFIGIIAGAVLAVLVVIGLIISSFYRKATKERAFVRTGMGGQKVVMNGGLAVFPVIHDVIWINMNTLRLEVHRSAEAALITRDRMRVDVTAEFYVRVKPTIDAIADAAQTLGQRTQKPMDLKELIEGKFVDALRSVAAEMGMEELHEKRMDFVQRVQTTVSEDLLKNGLELESVSLTSLDQTSQEHFNPQNAFDAQGLTRLTEEIESRRKIRNDIEQETRIQVERKNLEAEQLSFQIKREAEYARLENEREIETRRAEQAALIAQERAEQEKLAKSASILAQQEVDAADIEAKKLLDEKRIAAERLVREQEISKAQTLEAAEIVKRKAIELGEQDRAIAIAEKSREQSEAEAAAARARAARVAAEEEVITVKEVAAAERRKQIEVIQAAEVAEQEAIKIKVAAEAEKFASLDQSEAVRTLAAAEAEKIRIAAEGEANAEKLRADAKKAMYEVEAKGREALHLADNQLSEEMIALRIKEALIKAMPEIIRESVKPMERIEGIRIMQVEGLTGSSHGGGNSGSGEGNLADQVVNSALRYRAQAPLVDSLMKELGLEGGDLQSLQKALSPTEGPNKDSSGEAGTVEKG